ncbi:hypothetical protein [Arthrobacter rhizosphaerae]|uniref:hypothetical protein n=1 Tax=Arthrobacter rhizosphaerae TaxID=2855490 RepID=UPI001FF10DF3|nr:hypothetical protein [Arthrobacter rhizosphaerae]
MAGTKDPSNLHGFARGAAAIIGLIVLGAGVLAVFTVVRDWGPITLLIIGAVLLLLALVGRPPRLKWEGKEVEWPAAEVGAVLADHAEDLPAADRDALLDELSRISPETANPVLQAMLAETRIMALLERGLPEGTELLPSSETQKYVQVGGNLLVDGVLRDETGKQVLVEVRGGGRLPTSLMDALDRIKKLDATLVGGLLVTERMPPKLIRDQYAARGWHVHVVDQSNLDVAALQTAIWSAFNSSGQV